MPSLKSLIDWNSVEKVYRCVCAHPGEFINHICDELNLSEEKINSALDELAKSGLVKFKFAEMSPVMKTNYPVETPLLMTPKLKIQLKKFLSGKN
ncbi:MAG TPA: hypothetical protein VJJ76_00340 [archaeon]|nr:hypothetical protein [archaeon]